MPGTLNGGNAAFNTSKKKLTVYERIENLNINLIAICWIIVEQHKWLKKQGNKDWLLFYFIKIFF